LFDTRCGSFDFGALGASRTDRQCTAEAQEAGMSSLLTVAIVDPNDETREVLQRDIAACADLAWLEADCQRYEVFLEVVEAQEPHIALVSVDGDESAALPLIQQLSALFPQVAVIAYGSNTDARFAADLIRMGARDYVLFPPREGEIAEVFGRVAATAQPSANVGRAAVSAASRRIIAFGGTDGGIGSTTLAVNIGCILAQDPSYSVVLVDLDLALGDAHILLDLSPRTTLTQLVQNIDQIDSAYLKRAVGRHNSGLNIIPHPDKMTDVEFISPDSITRLLTLLKRNYTHVLVDMSKAYTPLDQAAMSAADDVLIVMQPDMNSLYNLMRLNESLDPNSAIADNMKLVANRVGADFAISIEKAESSIGKKIQFQIPNDSRTATYARDNGKPLYEHARGARMFQSMVQMANALTGRERRTPSSNGNGPASGSLFGRLFGAKSKS
jgi:pilus assembly protein CpaE